MGNNRRLMTLGDLGPIITGKTPSTKVPGHFGGTIPFVTPRDMDGRRTIKRTERYLTEKGAKAVANAIIPPGSIMVSCIGSDMGKVAIAGRQCVTNQQINSIIVSAENIAEYVYYDLSRRKHELRLMASGSAQPILNKGHFSQVKIEMPEPVEQRAIAHILGSLDDKIELNRQMNRTLEKMAQAIFKSWFIDFDPVRAKAEGRDPGLPKEIADLFPDSFEDSELGPIPKGWKVRPIGEAVQCVGGSTPSTKNPKYWDGGTNPFVTPKDMSSLISPVILGTERHITDAGVEKISSRQLPVGTVLLSSRAPIGYLAITEIPVSVNQGIIAMICNGDLPNHYVLQWTRTNMDIIKSNAGGTTFAEISKRNFRPIPVVIPPLDLLDAFVDQVGPLHQQLVLNCLESRELTAIRDTLLPKLISGELRVPDAEKLVEGTV